jgi:hypothetical protein
MEESLNEKKHVYRESNVTMDSTPTYAPLKTVRERIGKKEQHTRTEIQLRHSLTSLRPLLTRQMTGVGYLGPLELGWVV